MSDTAHEARPDVSRVVVANAGAGSTDTDAVHAAVARLAADAPVELAWTDEPDEFVDVVRGLDPAQQLVVAGGDGSIHLALETVTATGRNDQPVGIVPLGTGNDFARNHGIPLDPVEAAGVIAAGRSRGLAALRIGAGHDEGNGGAPSMVANNLHLGLGVRAAQTAASLKSTLGRLAYPVATAYQGVAARSVELTVDVDGATVHEGPLQALLVLLGPSMGGGVEVLPADPADMDVVMVHPAGPARRVGLVRAALRGRLPDASKAERHAASTVTVGRANGARAQGLDANLDGELVHLDAPLRLSLVPDAWRVITPQ